MFKLWKHGNGVWYVLYGPRLRRRASTGARHRNEAEIYLSQFIAGFNEPTIESPTVAQVLHAYRDDHGKTLRSRESLKYAVASLEKRLGNLKPDHISPTVLKRYALERGVAPGTVLREVGVLRAALGYAHAHRMIPSRPVIRSPVKPPPPRQRWLTREEAAKLIKACHELHMRCFVVLALATCARTSALIEAKWSQVDFERRLLDFGEGHGNKRRAVVPLNDKAMEALRLLKELSCTEYVFEYHGRHIRWIKRGFTAACERAGLSDVSPHTLRHTGATWMVMEGVPLAQVARMLGDTERSVERVYAKWGPDYLRAAASALQVALE